jgi:hypothetical protein
MYVSMPHLVRVIVYWVLYVTCMLQRSASTSHYMYDIVVQAIACRKLAPGAWGLHHTSMHVYTVQSCTNQHFTDNCHQVVSSHYYSKTRETTTAACSHFDTLSVKGYCLP